MSFLSQFSPLFVLTTERKERGLHQRERNKKHIIVVENATLRALCDVRRREMSITVISLRQSPSFSCEKRRDIHHRRPLSRYFSRVEARQIFCSLLSSFVVKNALNEKKKRIEREREKRDANVFSLLSPRKRENTIPYSHETMPYFSLLYIYMYEVCVCVAC